MAHPQCLLLAFLLTSLALSHSTEPGAPQGKKRQGHANTLQRPPQGLHGHGSSRGHGRHGGSGPRATKAGLLSHRPLHPLVIPEDDGTGLEGMRPVRLETGPGRERDRDPSQKSLSPGRDNNLLGTRKGRGHKHGNGHGQHFEQQKQGSRHDRGRHGKGESAQHNASCELAMNVSSKIHYQLAIRWSGDSVATLRLFTVVHAR